jgi:hypothetical protein
MAVATDIAANIESVRERIAGACQRAGRSPREVTLIAVTKTVEPPLGEDAYHGDRRADHVHGERYRGPWNLPCERQLCVRKEDRVIGYTVQLCFDLSSGEGDCVVRCPQNVHITDIMYTLKGMAIRAKMYQDAVEDIIAFLEGKPVRVLK